MGKKKKRTLRAVSDERVDQLRQALEAGRLDTSDDAEVAALARDLSDREAVDSLVGLADLVDGKLQRKAVNQALYRLKQRGLNVPDLRERPKGIRIAPKTPSAAGLPALMSRPAFGGARHFFLPVVGHGAVQLLHVAFLADKGLSELSGSETTRSGLRATFKGVLDSLPEDQVSDWIEVDQVLVSSRKLWEVHRCVASGRTGSDVQTEVVAGLRWPEERPPHPALELDLPPSAVRRLKAWEDPSRLAVFLYHQALVGVIEDTLTRLRESTIVLTQVQQYQRVRDESEQIADAWLARWGFEDLVELLLDAAFFHYHVGERDVAAFLLYVAGPSDAELRLQRCRELLTDFVEFWLMKGVEGGDPGEGPDGSEESPGGIILP